MGSFAQAARFTSTHNGHRHLDTPTVHFGAEPPDPEKVELSLGDLWVQTFPNEQ